MITASQASDAHHQAEALDQSARCIEALNHLSIISVYRRFLLHVPLDHRGVLVVRLLRAGYLFRWVDKIASSSRMIVYRCSATMTVCSWSELFVLPRRSSCSTT